MSRKTVIVSDWSGEVIEHHLSITIERSGFMIEFPEGNFTNRLTVDVEPQNAKDLLMAIKFKPVESMGMMTKNMIVG